MKLFYKIFKTNKNNRESLIVFTSGLGIAVNLMIASVKIILGLLTSSIAIVSEGANNATDALSSVLTLTGIKPAGKTPDKKHPFGYRRIEYLTGLFVSVFMVFGIYAVDNDSEESRAIRKSIEDFVKINEHIKSFHAVYYEPETEKIYRDLVADYDLKNTEALSTEFTEYMKKLYPHSDVVLTVETEYV